MDQQTMEQMRKRKRMQSNRESARRSRQRKQKHVDDLTAQAGQLQNQNTQILTTIDVTAQLYVSLEAENTVLRAQLVELENRLQSLNDMVQYFVGSPAPAHLTGNITCMGSPVGTNTTTSSSGSDPDSLDLGFDFDGFSMDSWVVPFDSHTVSSVMPVVDSFFCA